MPVTLKDIALATGLTEATVSNAINNRGKMSPATRERVLSVVKQMGYTPNINAKNLAVNRSKTIGVVVPDLENPFYGKMIKQVSIQCQMYGYYTSIANSFNDPVSEEQAIRRMVSERIEGLLISPINYGIPNTKYISLLEKNKVKYCFLSNRIPDKHYPFVMTDLGQGTYLLVKHLLETGRKNIYFLVGKGGNAISVNRMDGYRRAFTEQGLSVHSDFFVYCDTYDFDEGYGKTAQLLQTGNKIDAIITLNDFMAAGALSALSEASIKIPQEIAVAGYDDMFFSQITSVPLTTVRQNLEEMSRLSVEALLKMIQDDTDTGVELYLQPELIIRNSTM